MPSKTTKARAARDRRQGKAATTQAGEYVREEMEHAKRGKHPVKSRKQAVAIGLSKARRAGVKVPAKGKSKSRRTPSARRSRKTSTRRGTSRRGEGRR